MCLTPSFTLICSTDREDIAPRSCECDCEIGPSKTPAGSDRRLSTVIPSELLHCRQCGPRSREAGVINNTVRNRAQLSRRTRGFQAAKASLSCLPAENAGLPCCLPGLLRAFICFVVHPQFFPTQGFVVRLHIGHALLADAHLLTHHWLLVDGNPLLRQRYANLCIFPNPRARSSLFAAHRSPLDSRFPTLIPHTRNRKSASTRALIEFVTGAALGCAARLSIANALTHRRGAMKRAMGGLTRYGVRPERSGFSHTANALRMANSRQSRLNA